MFYFFLTNQQTYLFYLFNKIFNNNFSFIIFFKFCYRKQLKTCISEFLKWGQILCFLDNSCGFLLFFNFVYSQINPISYTLFYLPPVIL